jgi:hypothetical protein
MSDKETQGNKSDQKEQLTVRKEVVRNLTAEELSAVHGGEGVTTGGDTSETPTPGHG